MPGSKRNVFHGMSSVLTRTNLIKPAEVQLSTCKVCISWLSDWLSSKKLHF